MWPTHPPDLNRHHDDVDDLVLEREAMTGWVPLETLPLGGWVLRFGDGWTGRANSVLPLGDPGMALDVALEFVHDAYHGRGLRPMIAVPRPAREDLASALQERGWTSPWGGLVMTAPASVCLEAMGPPDPAAPEVATTDAPDDGWLSAYHYRGGALPDAAVEILSAGPDVAFHTVLIDGAVAAIARTTTNGRWRGLNAVEVDPAFRRRGLARLLLRHVVRKGHDLWLQVEPRNQAAVELYRRCGFTVHHAYRYAVPA